MGNQYTNTKDIRSHKLSLKSVTSRVGSVRTQHEMEKLNIVDRKEKKKSILERAEDMNDEETGPGAKRKQSKRIYDIKCRIDKELEDNVIRADAGTEDTATLENLK